MPNEVQFGGASWQCDLGAGRSLEVEINESGEPWLSVSREIEKASIWIASVGGGEFKLRIGIERTKNGLKVVLDQGEEKGGWWDSEFAPHLSVELDENQIASVSTKLLPSAADVDVAAAPGAPGFVIGRRRVSG